MHIKMSSLAIPEIKVLVPDSFKDNRGVFAETYNRKTFEAAGIRTDFVQDNHSISRHAGTVRGLHFQLPPFAQDKLIRVVRGRIFDVVVDIRRTSPTFGQHVSIELGADSWDQLFVPKGFAHGFCSLEGGTEVLYKTSNVYAPSFERGILWRDPGLAISWPVSPDQAIMSDKDRSLSAFREARDLF